MSKRSRSSRVSNPITCWSVTHWASTPHGMPCPQAKKTSGTFRPLERGFEDKAPGFVAHHGPLHPGLPTALRRRFGEENNGPDDLVIVLDGIDRVLPNVCEFFLCR